MRRLPVLLLIIFLAGCRPQPTNTAEPTSLPSTAAEAEQTLIEFFSSLHAKEYTGAVSFYGGSYETLQGNNPDLDPSDHAALWARGCEVNGLQCLEVRTATFVSVEVDTYIFQVEFNNPDGSLFVRGPCCGADETEMPPVSEFEYRVSRNIDGKFVVMDLPPYIP